MKAVVIRTVEDGPRLEEVTVDQPQPGEALVRMVASGICGSDLHVVHGKSAAAVFPTVMGHEGSGVVEAVGERVTAVAVGDRVVLAGGPPVGHRVHAEGTDLNIYAGQGSMAEYAVVSQHALVKIPDDVPLDVMALVGCGVLTGIGTVLNGPRPVPGGNALVLGCGGVGLNIIQALRMVGVSVIIAADNNPTRLGGASSFGATHLVDTSDVGVERGVRTIIPDGVDCAYEVVGDADLTAQAWESVRPGGTCVMVGAATPGSFVQIDARQLLYTQKTLTSVLMGGAPAATEIPRIINLYKAGQIKLDELVGARLPLDSFSKAIADTESGAVARALLTISV